MKQIKTASGGVSQSGLELRTLKLPQAPPEVQEVSVDSPNFRPAPLGRLAYRVAEVAQILGVSTDKVYELVRANIIPHIRLGRRIIIPCQPFHQWLNNPESWASYDAGGHRG